MYDSAYQVLIVSTTHILPTSSPHTHILEEWCRGLHEARSSSWYIVWMWHTALERENIVQRGTEWIWSGQSLPDFRASVLVCNSAWTDRILSLLYFPKYL